MTYKVECAKCGGRGEIKAFSGIAGGVCFCCNGKGHVILKNKPQRTAKFGISAIDRESGERVSPVFWINAKSEADAVKKAVAKLSNGTGYIAESAQIIEV